MSNPWPKVSLGELIRLERRPVKVEPDKLYQEIGIYCFGRGIFHKTPRTGFEVGNKDLFLMREGDFILQVTFAWEGAVAIVSDAEDGMYGSTRYPTFQVDESRCAPRFLLNYFKTEEGLQQLVKICPGSAGRNRVLSIKRIPEVLVPLPPLPEQRRIVARIEELAAQIQDARTLRQQAAEEAEALGISGGTSAFGDTKTRFGSKRLEQLTTRITKGESPEWQGFTYQESGPLFVRSENVLWGRLNPRNAVHIPRAFHEKLSRSQLRKDDVLINLVGASIGRVCSVSADLGDANVNQAVGVISPNMECLLPAFLVHFLLSSMAQNEIHGGKVETARPNISLCDVRILEIPTPPLPEQRRIVAELDALQAQVDTLKRLQTETAAELDALLPSILDKAFKGEL